MKKIKYFMYKNTYEFERFLDKSGCSIWRVKGFSVSNVERYHGNVLKTYMIHSNDGKCLFFKVVFFKSFHEQQQASSSIKINRMSGWYSDAHIVKYKVDGEYVIAF